MAEFKTDEDFPMTDEQLTQLLYDVQHEPWGARPAERGRIDKLLREIYNLRMGLLDEGVGHVHVALRNYAKDMGWAR